jgi:intein/homing endonuclease
MSGCCKRTDNLYGRKARGREVREKHTARIIDLYKSGLSTNAIGMEVGANGGVVCTILRESGIAIKSTSEWKRKYSVNHEAFSEIDNEESAYWLGFLYADGCNCPKTSSVTLSQNSDDVDVLYGFRKFLKSDYAIKSYKRTSGYNKKDLFVIHVKSRKLSRDLEKHGCVEAKTHKLSFPKFIREDLIRHFVRGYFDGDGSIGKHPNYQLSVVGTESFLTGLGDTLKLLFPDVAFQFYKRHPERMNNITQMGVTKKRHIKTILDWMYDDCSVFLSRKHRKYLEFTEHSNTTKRKW